MLGSFDQSQYEPTPRTYEPTPRSADDIYKHRDASRTRPYDHDKSFHMDRRPDSRDRPRQQVPQDQCLSPKVYGRHPTSPRLESH